MRPILLMVVLVAISCVAVGCTTEQLQGTGQVLHSINAGTVPVVDFNDINDPNVLAVRQIIQETIDLYHDGTASGKIGNVVDAAAPVVLPYVGWLGWAGYAAYNIYRNRKNK